MVGLRSPPQRLREGSGADRHEHELLEVDVVVGVGPAVDDVHHRDREHVGVGAAHVPVQRQLELVGRGLGHGQRGAQDGVGPQPALVVGPVEGDELAVEPALVEGLEPHDRVADLAVDGLDGPEDPPAAIPVAAVAPLDGLVLPR